MNPLQRLRHHVTGAIERGEREPIAGIPANYSAQQYRDPGTGRTRWAVLHAATGVWYFPERYGRQAAEQLARSRTAQDRAYAGLDSKFLRALEGASEVNHD